MDPVARPPGHGPGENVVLPPGALHNLPLAALYVTGPDLVVQFVNESCQRLLGGRVVPGRPFGQSLPEVAAHNGLARLRQVMDSGEPTWEHEVEVWVQPESGPPQLIVADVYCQPVRDHSGAVTGVLTLGADVSAQVRGRAERAGLATALEATEGRYRTLFQTLPIGVIYYSADGLVLGANPAAVEILGLDPDAIVTWPLVPAWSTIEHADGTAFTREDYPVVRALRTGRLVHTLMSVTHARTGEPRWLDVTAVPDARDGAGRPQRAYAMLRDVTAQHRMDAALRDNAELMSRLRDSNVLGVTVMEEGRVVEANAAYLDIIGYGEADLRAGRIAWPKVTPPEWAAASRRAMDQLRERGACEPFEKEIIHRDGHRVPVLIGSTATGRDPLRWVSYVVDLSARRRAEARHAGRAATEQAVQAERAERERARRRVTLLAQVGELVAAARDTTAFVERAAGLAVLSLADFCVIFLPDGAASLVATSVASRAGSGAVTVTRLAGYRIPRAGRLTVQQAWMTGRTQLVRGAPLLVAGPGQAGQPLREIVHRLRPDCLLAVPLPGGPGPGPGGVLVLGRAAARSCFHDPADITVAAELARQVAAGLNHAGRWAQDLAATRTLQRAMLPGALPEIPGLDLAARYLPGTVGADIGGDWYDAFPLGNGRAGLAVGDVAGHNIAAATVMSQVRTLVRAYATDRAEPGTVLAATGGAMARLLPEALATVVYAVLDLQSGQLRYASAGHPPPVCVSPAGRVSYLRSPTGAMLGAPGPARVTTARRQLRPGSRLLFYSDGLIEDREQDLSRGLATLAQALRPPVASAEQMCGLVERALLGGGPRADDVSLLAARLTG